MQRNNWIFLLLAFSAIFAACNDDGVEPTPSESLVVPSDYSAFENVSYSGQTQRLQQFIELSAYIKSANTKGTPLDESRLLAMFSNNAAEANWQGTYEESKQIENKTLEAVRPQFRNLLSALATSSQSTENGEPGKAGVVMSKDGSKSYLLNANGVEEGQLFEKSLMGAHIYYQICEVYTGSGKMDVDNSEVEAGKGTAMQHHWDEAFGYFGVPMEFPTNSDNIVYWGKYSNGRDADLNCNMKIMDAFLKGRAAIDANNLSARDEAISSLRKELEVVPASTAIHYINSALTNADDPALRSHALSEALGFVYSLQFNPQKTMNAAQIEEIFSLIGGDTDWTKVNLYDVSDEDLKSAKQKLADAFLLNDIKDRL